MTESSNRTLAQCHRYVTNKAIDVYSLINAWARDGSCHMILPGPVDMDRFCMPGRIYAFQEEDRRLYHVSGSVLVMGLDLMTDPGRVLAMSMRMAITARLMILVSKPSTIQTQLLDGGLFEGDTAPGATQDPPFLCWYEIKRQDVGAVYIPARGRRDAFELLGHLAATKTASTIGQLIHSAGIHGVSISMAEEQRACKRCGDMPAFHFVRPPKQAQQVMCAAHAKEAEKRGHYVEFGYIEPGAR